MKHRMRVIPFSLLLLPSLAAAVLEARSRCVADEGYAHYSAPSQDYLVEFQSSFGSMAVSRRPVSFRPGVPQWHHKAWSDPVRLEGAGRFSYQNPIGGPTFFEQ